MTTRTKLSITTCVVSLLMFLNVFSKPLHIPQPLQWVLTIGTFLPIGLMFYFIKLQKRERQSGGAHQTGVSPAAAIHQSARARLIWMMVLGSLVGLCSPLWMPLTGTTLGPRGDFVCGIITAVFVCTILGLRLRRL